MPRQSITLTTPNDEWLKARIESDEYSNKSEAVNDLIRQARRREESIEEIRTALIEGEQSGTTELSVDDIWAEARNSGADA